MYFKQFTTPGFIVINWHHGLQSHDLGCYCLVLHSESSVRRALHMEQQCGQVLSVSVKEITMAILLWLFTSFNPFPTKPWFLNVCSRCLLKTQLEQEKLHMTSNFSFSIKYLLPVWRTFIHFYQS